MKKIFIVVGPECSGTRIVTRLLCMAGCAGDYEHEQRLDRFVHEEDVEIDTILGKNEAIVLRRSVPHGKDHRPDILRIGAKFQAAGYEPYYIITMRDWICNAKSKIKIGQRPILEVSKKNLTEEWSDIGGMFAGFAGRFYIILTSYLFICPERALNGLENWLELNFPPGSKDIIFDADAKYYE